MSERERQEQMEVVARLEEQQRCERVKKDDLKAVGEKTIYADIQRCTDEILRLDKEIFRAREQLAEVQHLAARAAFGRQNFRCSSSRCRAWNARASVNPRARG